MYDHRTNIYAFRWYHYALQHSHDIHHESGRRKGCASVFLEREREKHVSRAKSKSPFDVSSTHSTYLSRSTTLGSLKRR